MLSFWTVKLCHLSSFLVLRENLKQINAHREQSCVYIGNFFCPRLFDSHTDSAHHFSGFHLLFSDHLFELDEPINFRAELLSLFYFSNSLCLLCAIC